MKLTLDGQSVDTAPMRGQTLSQLIRAVERELTPERVITSMTLDGRPLDGQSERDEADTAVEELKNLDIRTQRVDALARGTLENVIAFIPGLAGSITACVEALHAGDDKTGHQHLGRLIEGLQIVSSALPLIARSLPAGGDAEGELLPQTEEFKDLLLRIAAAQESADTVLLCDLLEFELAGILEDWLKHSENLLGTAGGTD